MQFKKMLFFDLKPYPKDKDLIEKHQDKINEIFEKDMSSTWTKNNVLGRIYDYIAEYYFKHGLLNQFAIECDNEYVIKYHHIHYKDYCLIENRNEEIKITIKTKSYFNHHDKDDCVSVRNELKFFYENKEKGNREIKKPLNKKSFFLMYFDGNQEKLFCLDDILNDFKIENLCIEKLICELDVQMLKHYFHHANNKGIMCFGNSICKMEAYDGIFEHYLLPKLENFLKNELQ